jgi:hypothetical protein
VKRLTELHGGGCLSRVRGWGGEYVLGGGARIGTLGE